MQSTTVDKRRRKPAIVLEFPTQKFLDQVDRAAKEKLLSRSAFLRQIVLEYLKNSSNPDAVTSGLGSIQNDNAH